MYVHDVTRLPWLQKLLFLSEWLPSTNHEIKIQVQRFQFYKNANFDYMVI